MGRGIRRCSPGPPRRRRQRGPRPCPRAARAGRSAASALKRGQRQAGSERGLGRQGGLGLTGVGPEQPRGRKPTGLQLPDTWRPSVRERVRLSRNTGAQVMWCAVGWMVSPPLHTRVHVLRPRTCGCNLTWKNGLCRCDYLLGPKSSDQWPREREGDTEGRSQLKMRQRLEGRGHKPRDAWSPRGWERQEGPAPEPPEGAGGLQNRERRHVCPPEPPGCILRYGRPRRLTQAPCAWAWRRFGEIRQVSHWTGQVSP